MKVTFKGIFLDIETKEVKENEFVQKLIIKRPERKDDFGEVVQKESVFEIGNYIKDANKDASKVFDLKDWQNKKVEVTAYLNSVEQEKDGKKARFLNLNFREIKIIP